MIGDLCAAIGGAGLPTSLALPVEPLAERDWYALLQEAQRQKLLRMLGDAVEDGSFPTTSAQRSQIGFLELDTRRTEHVLTKRLVRASQLLRQRGIDHRVLKGTAISRLAYRVPDHRYANDVDLLVGSRDFDAAVAVLVSDGGVRARPEVRSGFISRFGKGVNIRYDGGVSIDLHRMLASGAPGLTIDAADLIRSPQRYEVAGEPLLGLGPEAMFLHACYHAVTMRTPYRVIAHRDIIETQRAFRDALDGAIEMAARWSGRAVVARGVLAADRLFGLTEPSPLASWAGTVRPTARERHVMTVADPAYARGAAGQLLDTLRVIDSTPDRVAYLRGQLFPSAEYRAFKGSGLGRRWRAGISSLRPSRQRVEPPSALGQSIGGPP